MSDSLEVNPYGVLFTGSGVTVEIALFLNKNAHGLNDVLLKINGAPAYSQGIDGKALRYLTVPAGQGQNFVFMKGGREVNRMTKPSSWGNWDVADLFLDDQTIKLKFYNPKDEKPHVAPLQAQPLHLLTDYKKRLSEAPGRLVLERELKNTFDATKGKNWNPEYQLQWGGQEKNPEALLLVGAAVSSLPPIFEILLADSSAGQALLEFKKFTVQLAEGSDVVLKKQSGELTLVLGANSGDEGMKETLIQLFESQF